MNRYLFIAFAEHPVQIERVPESIHLTPHSVSAQPFIVYARRFDAAALYQCNRAKDLRSVFDI
jgi:hypothetical protein